MSASSSETAGPEQFDARIQKRRLQRMRGQSAGIESSYVKVTWPKCARSACSGVRLRHSDHCLPHATEGERDAFLSALTKVGESAELDLRGVGLNGVLFSELLKAAPRDADGRAYFNNLQCDAAVFDCLKFIHFEGCADEA